MPRPFNAPMGRPPRSSRRRARWAATRAAMVMANQAAAAVSWLACGSPSGAQARASASRLSALRLSGAQREAAAGFLASVRPFARRGLSTLRGGRASVASLLPVLSSDAYNIRERVAGTSTTTSKASFVVASRVSLPTSGAVIPVSRWLSQEWAARLARPDGLLRPDCREAFGFAVRPSDPPQLDRASVGCLIPRPAFLVRRSEYRQLLQLLRERGLVEFRDPRHLPKHPVTGRVLVAGILGADKKDGAQRLLLDRRPPNAVEERLHGLPLPFAGDFVRLELGPEEVVRTSLRDGKDQYYIMRQDDARIQWQAFGQPVDNDWFPGEPAVRNGAPWLQPCFTALIQGDHNAADIAEEVGHAILCQSGAFPEDDLMPASRGPKMRASLRGDPSIISDLYIDDAGVVAIADPSVKSPGAQRTMAATAALRAAGVEVHDKKGHNDALDEKVWGCAFYRHIVGAERERMVEIVALSWAMAFAPAVVPAALASLIGYWSHALLFRRAGYAVLQDSYEVARDASTAPLPLPLAVRDELLALACLAPLLYSDLRVPVSSTVVATDATPTRGAAASAVVPLLTARRLFAGAEFRGADARLVDRVDLRDVDAAPAADPALAAALAAWPWQVRAAYDMEVDHINAQELRALVGLITRRCRSSANFKQRLVALLDNLAACGAAAKGRSSSRHMNRLLRRLGVFLLAADVYIAPRYIASAVNPADPPSRRRSLSAWLARMRAAAGP